MDVACLDCIHATHILSRPYRINSRAVDPDSRVGGTITVQISDTVSVFKCLGDWEQVNAIRSPVIGKVSTVVDSGKCSRGSHVCRPWCVLGN